MGFIYKITNKINGKSYIGKTKFSIEKRFKEHIRDSKRGICRNRPLYSALNKYGFNNFYVESICEVKDELELCKKEIYYIEKFDTYKNGYNGTKGGDGASYLFLDQQEIIDDYMFFKNMTTVAELHNCNRCTIRNILNSKNIKKFDVKNTVKIKIIELDKEFKSMRECAKYLIDNKIVEANDYIRLSKTISESIRRNKKSYGFTFIKI